ncbi:MAG: hydrolase, partial [Acidobacteria bacterium]
MMKRRQFLKNSGTAGAVIGSGWAGSPLLSLFRSEKIMNSQKQEMRRKALYELLGDLPPRNRKISGKKVSQQEQPGYILEKLTLDLNGIEPVPAYFVRPKKLNGRVPVILYNHAHGGDYKLGKDELLRGREALQKPPYAELLTSIGCCALCLDT